MEIDREKIHKIKKAISSRNSMLLSDEEKIIALEVILELLSAKEKRELNLKIHLSSVGR